MLGTQIDGCCRLEAKLGRGGMGVVYRAHDSVLKRDVAVKLLSVTGLGTDGRGEQPYGMNAETAALFPDRFEVVNGREVPAGWRVGSIGDLVKSLVDSAKPNRGKDCEEYVALDDMLQKSIDLAKQRSGADVNSSIIRFSEGDILFGSMRPYFHKVGLAQFDGITRTTTFVLRSQRAMYRSLALFVLSSDEAIAYATKSSVGTTMPYVKWNALKKYGVIIPNDQLIQAFEKFISPTTNQIKDNGMISNTLAELRDTLLPRLMSGQLRLDNV